MTDTAASSQPPDQEAVLAALRRVIDPEAGMNIVDLGLVYRIDIGADAVAVDMTMTSPACPMGDMMVDEVKSVLDQAVPSGFRTAVRLVWSPPWDPSRMSETARKHFNW
jgi:metal-sulfur cluster biosynthetic enzyme